MHKGLAPVGESMDASICRSWGRAAGADNNIVGSSIFEHPQIHVRSSTSEVVNTFSSSTC